MKFFTTALAAFAVGSAVAAPVVDRAAPLPPRCTCSGDGVSVPSIKLPTPCTTITGDAVHSSVPAPLPGGDSEDNSSSHAAGDKELSVVVGTLVETVVDVEDKVNAQLELVAKIVGAAEVDAQALLKVVVELVANLEVLKTACLTLDGLVVDAEALVASDLELVLSLVAKVQILVTKIEGCLKGVVALKQEILAIIGAQLKICLDLVSSISGPVVKFALSFVASVKGHVTGDLLEIVTKITGCVGEIKTTTTSLDGLVAPVFKLLNL